MKQSFLLLLSLLLFSACAGLDYSRTYPAAEKFHPQTIIILPVAVGSYETAQELVEDILARKVRDTGWYKQIIAPHVLKAKLALAPEISEEVNSYIVLLNTLGVSDRTRARKIGQIYQARALLSATINEWGYGWVDGEKTAWLSLSLTLADVITGDIVWRARHKLKQEYFMRQPSLGDLCETLSTQMLQEMPH